MNNTDKFLSIAIPSYNMEKYLERCLDSLILGDTELMNKLDIIVVNDGSTDRTSEIAHSYTKRFPNAIRVIDKQNGHYGSCINAALTSATGRYFRILDADDWFDTSALKNLISYLQASESDVIYTSYTKIIDGKKTVVAPPDNVVFGHEYKLTSQLPFSISYLFMHQITYKTDFLRSFGFKQTEGICYTDNEYIYYPMIRAKSIVFYECSLYQYSIGREEQSISAKALYKNRTHQKTIADKILSSPKPDKKNILTGPFREMYLTTLYEPYITQTLLVSNPSKDEYNKLNLLLQTLRSNEPHVYDNLMSLHFHGLPYVRLAANWPIIASVILTPIRIAKRRTLK